MIKYIAIHIKSVEFIVCTYTYLTKGWIANRKAEILPNIMKILLNNLTFLIKLLKTIDITIAITGLNNQV